MKNALRTGFGILLVSQAVTAGAPRLEEDLSGRWRFTLGNNASFASAEFNDSKWEKIRVQGVWERQGYEDYDGYA